MKAVFRHELASYFSNMTGYVFGAFLLLFAGIYTMVYNLKGGITNFEYVPAGMDFAFLVIVPILTMRVLAEERRQKTDQLLYSLPITMMEVVLGKFAALLVVLAVPVAIVGLYPFILCLYGNVHFPAVYSSLCGFFFLGAALIAVGIFISSITESQAVAAGVCFALLLVNYFLSDLASYLSTTAFSSLTGIMIMAALISIIAYRMTKNGLAAGALCLLLEIASVTVFLVDSTLYEGLLPEVIKKMSLFQQFYVFVDGIFDIRSLVYFASICVVFLFLSVQSMEKRRWSE